jgi:hypothetical protein
MPQTHINVEQWVEVFSAIGLEKADRQKWHREFEQRYPEGHQSFLEWLGLPVERIQQIRQHAREG